MLLPGFQEEKELIYRWPFQEFHLNFVFKKFVLLKVNVAIRIPRCKGARFLGFIYSLVQVLNIFLKGQMQLLIRSGFQGDEELIFGIFLVSSSCKSYLFLIIAVSDTIRISRRGNDRFFFVFFFCQQLLFPIFFLGKCSYCYYQDYKI